MSFIVSDERRENRPKGARPAQRALPANFPKRSRRCKLMPSWSSDAHISPRALRIAYHFSTLALCSSSVLANT